MIEIFIDFRLSHLLSEYSLKWSRYVRKKKGLSICWILFSPSKMDIFQRSLWVSQRALLELYLCKILGLNINSNPSKKSLENQLKFQFFSIIDINQQRRCWIRIPLCSPGSPPQLFLHCQVLMSSRSFTPREVWAYAQTLKQLALFSSFSPPQYVNYWLWQIMREKSWDNHVALFFY